MPNLRTRTATCIIATLLIQNVLAPIAAADNLRLPIDNEPRLMFYMSKGFGESRKLRSAPKLGLRYERSVERDAGSSLLDRTPRIDFSQSLIDLRWTRGYGQSLHLFGAPVYRSPMRLNSSDLGSSAADESSMREIGESSGGYGYWFLAAVLGAGILCLAEEVICEDNPNYVPPEEDTGPAPDTGT